MKKVLLLELKKNLSSIVFLLSVIILAVKKYKSLIF